jgi:hypothetical protein
MDTASCSNHGPIARAAEVYIESELHYARWMWFEINVGISFIINYILF